MSSVQPPNGASVIPYTYDRRGRVIRAGADQYTYNIANQLTAATVRGQSATHRYDGDGRRLSTTTPAGTTETIWAPMSYQLVAATARDANNAPVVTRSYASGLIGFRTGDPAAADAGGARTGWNYLHQDLQGSARAVTGANGTLDSTAIYEPYGLVRDRQDLDPSAPRASIGWAGEMSDATTGASHLRATEYDPRLGAFTTPDPVPATSFSATRAYANANPMVYSDPMGTFGINLGSLAETLNAIVAPVAAGAGVGVGALVFPPLAPVAAVAGVLIAASSLYLACETCQSGKGPCGSAVAGAALDSVLGAGALAPLRSGLRAARAAKNADEVADIGHAGIHQFPGTLPRKSQFLDGINLGSLSSRTKGIDGIVQPNGNTRYVVRNPGGAGVDRTTGLPTDVFRVIRRPDDSVVTMFPGTSPKG